MRRIKKKHENLTYKYLCQILKDVTIDREFVINEPIYKDGKLIRNFIMVDFHWVVKDKVFLCEYNGTGHYKSVRRFGGKVALEKQKIRDEWLRQYCKIHKITLIELDGRVLRGTRIKRYLSSVL